MFDELNVPNQMNNVEQAQDVQQKTKDQIAKEIQNSVFQKRIEIAQAKNRHK